MSEKAIYIVADEHNNVLHLTGIEMMGRRYTLPAIFLTEDDALEILYVAEQQTHLAGHHIIKTSGTMKATE